MAEISVIVPVYNVEAYLPRCIDSILNQSFINFELVLVDDGSPDRCPAICDQYAQKDSRIHVIHQNNKGVSAARNTGIEWALTLSNSQWVAFIDSDDWIHPDYLRFLYETCVSLQVNLAVCDAFATGSDILYSKIDRPEYNKRAVRDLYRLGSGAPNMVSVCGKLFCKSQWKDIRFPTGKISEDRATTYKIIFQNNEIGILHGKFYYYFLNSDSLVHKQWTPRRLDDLESIQDQMKFFEERGMNEAWQYVAVSRLFCLKTSIEDLERIKPMYKEYYRKLHKELYKSTFRYRRKFLTVKGNEWVYERIFPRFMWLYWHLVAVLRILGHKEAEKS